MSKSKTDVSKKLSEARTSAEVAEACSSFFTLGVETVDGVTQHRHISTQYPLLNTNVLGIGGFPRGRIVEIAGAPSIGKTSLAQNLISHWQKNGEKILWVPAEPIDINYMSACGVNIKKKGPDCDNPIGLLKFTDSNDLSNKLKLFIALNSFDVIVIDSVQAVNTEEVTQAQDGFTMHTGQSSAKFWTDFLRQLEGGFSVKIGSEYVKSEVPVKEFKGGKFTDNHTIHRLENKDACLILTNHLKDGVGMFSIQYTPGGVGKNFRFSHRLYLNPTKGGTKKDSSGQIIYRDIKITSKKSKLGAPLGRSVIMRLQNGIFTEMERIDTEVDEDDEITPIRGPAEVQF